MNQTKLERLHYLKGMNFQNKSNTINWTPIFGTGSDQPRAN